MASSEEWKGLFLLLDHHGYFGFTGDADYLSAKNKMLNNKYQEISKQEYTQLLGALKSAEANLNKSNSSIGKQFAYTIRRVIYHGRESGFQEFSELKDRYGGCYIATVVYGSYYSPQVRVLRCYRDDCLEHSSLGRCFVRIYYKFSPAIA